MLVSSGPWVRELYLTERRRYTGKVNEGNKVNQARVKTCPLRMASGAEAETCE